MLLPSPPSDVLGSTGLTLAYGFPKSIIDSFVWGLLLYAAFGEESKPRTRYLIEDGDASSSAD